ncbi:Alpha/Beta hydrolase protein [Hypoxylon crocopeplum]|nr:Alpha/Beta hydrolase protein [Hypoxylon crocopeplum]
MIFKTAQYESRTNSSAITVTRRSDLSFFYKILRTVIRPLRPRLIAPNRQHPAGPPRLQKRPTHLGNVTITERAVLIPPEDYLHEPGSSFAPKTDNLWVYDFDPLDESCPSRHSSPYVRTTHTVYYFPGGGFQAPASFEHWKFCAHLASALYPSGCRIVLVSYSLAPNSPARTTLPLLQRWLTQALQVAAAEDTIVSLAGDSSGANVALSLGLWYADQLATADRRAPDFCALARLRSVLAISPPTDLRNANPGISAADKNDPVLGRRLADRAARAWAAGADVRHPYLSPRLTGLANLRAAGVQVNGVFGTADVLAPDALAFLEKCMWAGVSGKWLVWDGQMHCFPLASCYGLREGREGREWVVDVLRGVA